jgi:CHAD domain-containing protein
MKITKHYQPGIMKQFEKFVSGQFRSLIRNLKKWHLSSEPETLHRIRVDIKKIKAALAVIYDNKKEFKFNKGLKALRQIFRNAGAIRGSDVLTSLLKQHHIEVSYDELIPGDTKESVTALNSELPDSIRKIKKLRNKLKNDLKSIRRDDLEKYICRKKKYIEHKLNPEPQMSSLHKTRKTIKEVIYLSEADGVLKKKELKFYDQMQDVLGELHDKQVLIGLLKMKNSVATDTQKAIESACDSDKKEVLRLAMNNYRNH